MTDREKLAQRRLEEYLAANTERPDRFQAISDSPAVFLTIGDLRVIVAAISARTRDESPTALSPDAREALTWLAELGGGLPRAPMPVPGSEECYPGPDVPTRIVQAAVRALNREPADKPIGAEAIDQLYRPWRETTIAGPAPTRHRPR